MSATATFANLSPTVALPLHCIKHVIKYRHIKQSASVKSEEEHQELGASVNNG
jgi:hypothetical protein